MKCPALEVLAAWTDAQVTLEMDRSLRAHTLECARCAAATERMRVLTGQLRRLELAGAAPQFSVEFAAKLGERPSGRLLPWRALASALCIAALSGIAIDGFRSREPREEPGVFQARGGAARQGARVGFEVLVHDSGRAAIRLLEGQELAADSGYSFVVFNRSQEAQCVLLFALDARADVHWFYPAYLDPQADPQSIRVGPLPQVQPLPDGIAPDHPAPGPLRFVGVFSAAPLRVTEVEALIRRGGLATLAQAHADAEIQIMHAVVRDSKARP